MVRDAEFTSHHYRETFFPPLLTREKNPLLKTHQGLTMVLCKLLFTDMPEHETFPPSEKFREKQTYKAIAGAGFSRSGPSRVEAWTDPPFPQLPRKAPSASRIKRRQARRGCAGG